MSAAERALARECFDLDPEIQPTADDLDCPAFNAVWDVIKSWDIQRATGCGYAGATGTDVMRILRALAAIDAVFGGGGGVMKRHGRWYIDTRLVWFAEADSPRWFLRVWKFRIGWWPNDKRRLDIDWF